MHSRRVIVCSGGHELRNAVVFCALDREGNDFENVFTPALRRLGRIKYDEMYGFVPALALGGASSVDHLERVKAVEHLVMLAQLAPLRVITSPFAGD